MQAIDSLHNRAAVSVNKNYRFIDKNASRFVVKKRTKSETCSMKILLENCMFCTDCLYKSLKVLISWNSRFDGNAPSEHMNTALLPRPPRLDGNWTISDSCKHSCDLPAPAAPHISVIPRTEIPTLRNNRSIAVHPNEMCSQWKEE